MDFSVLFLLAAVPVVVASVLVIVGLLATKPRTLIAGVILYGPSLILFGASFLMIGQVMGGVLGAMIMLVGGLCTTYYIRHRRHII